MILASKLIQAIEAQQERAARPDRSYIGGSVLGDVCPRRLWYEFHRFGKRKVPARVLRIFKLGDHVEGDIVQLLRATPGVQIIDRDPKTGKQFEAVKYGGHIKSHYDGLVRAPALLDSDEWHLLEVKSMKHDGPRGFRALVQHGVAAAHPKYYSQMQFYMHSSIGTERPISRAVFLAMDKDNSELHGEIIHYDPMHGAILDATGKGVIEAKEPPPRIGNSPQWFECMWCDHRGHCWESEPVEVTDCRQCVFAAPVTSNAYGDAAWRCDNPQSPNYQRVVKEPCDHFTGYEGHIFHRGK